MITADHVLAGFRMLERAGIRRPVELAAPGDLRASAEVYAAVLADLDEEQLEQAVLAYARQPRDAGQFVKGWPEAGTLLELAPFREATLPAKDRPRRAKAWAEVLWGQVLLAARNCRTPPARWHAVDAVDALVSRALRALGGLRAVGEADGDLARASLRRAFLDAVLPGLEEQVDRVADGVRYPLLPPPVEPPLALPAPRPAPLVEMTPAEAARNRENRRRFREGLPLLDVGGREIGRPISGGKTPSRPAAPPPTAVRCWSAAHVTAGLCREADVGTPVPADWQHPAAKQAMAGGFKPPFEGA